MGVEALMVAMTVGAGALKAVGAVQEGNAAARAAEFNAKIAEQRAQHERMSAAAEAKDYRRAENRKLAATTAARGASGTINTAGSPLLVDEATVREIALGSARLRHQGAVNSARLRDEAELYKMNAKHSRRAGYLKAGESLLSTGSAWLENR